MKKSIITSPDNPEIKLVRKLLDDKQFRYERGEFVAEGVTALDKMRSPRKLFVREGADIPSVACEAVFTLPEKLFKSISSTENSRGVVAVAGFKVRPMGEIDTTGRYLLLDRIQDPGNVGALLRSACAFGYKGVIVTPGTADPFSPKAARSAAGALNLLDVFQAGDLGALAGFTVIAADMGGEDTAGFKWPGSFILALGNEGSGISDELRKISKHIVSIPMPGGMESLNVAVSSGILMYSSTYKHHE